MALAVDGSTSGSNSGPSITLSGLTTVYADVIILFVGFNDATVTPTVSSTTSTGWTIPWTIRSSGPNPLSAGLYEFYGVPGAALTNEIITVAATSCDFLSVGAFGISGANNSAPFDTNGSLPVLTGSGPASGVSSSNANDMLILSGRQGSVSNPGAPQPLVAPQ